MSAFPEQSDGSPPAIRQSPFRSGWLIGIVLGVSIGLIALPTVRFTLFGQLQFALSEESRPFMGVADVHETEREVSRLDATAGAAPDDYLLQVGRATALATIPAEVRLPAVRLLGTRAAEACRLVQKCVRRAAIGRRAGRVALAPSGGQKRPGG